MFPFTVSSGSSFNHYSSAAGNKKNPMCSVLSLKVMHPAPNWCTDDTLNRRVRTKGFYCVLQTRRSSAFYWVHQPLPGSACLTLGAIIARKAGCVVTCRRAFKQRALCDMSCKNSSELSQTLSQHTSLDKAPLIMRTSQDSDLRSGFIRRFATRVALIGS